MDLNGRLKRMVNSASCILFMKGNREQPKCGLSKMAIEILTEHNCDYETYNILSDEEIRQGLKEYSNCTTYPQLYVKGELVGGLEMICELNDNGKLSDMLPKNNDFTARLSSLMNNSELMLFVKCTPDQPDCDFTKHLMEIIHKLSCEYLTDDDEILRGPAEPHFHYCKKFINIYRFLQISDQTRLDLSNVVLFSKRLVDVLTDYVDPRTDTYEWSIIEMLLLEILRFGVSYTSTEDAPDEVRFAFDMVFQDKSVTTVIAKALSSNKADFIRLGIALTLKLQLAEDSKESLEFEMELINLRRFLKCQKTVEGANPGDFSTTFSNMTSRFDRTDQQMSRYKVIADDIEVSFAATNELSEMRKMFDLKNADLGILEKQNHELTKRVEDNKRDLDTVLQQLRDCQAELVDAKKHSVLIEKNLEDVLALEGSNSAIYEKMHAVQKKAFEEHGELRAKIKLIDPSLRAPLMK